ncbi:hypothetical protein NQZ68_002733 [Dissostichus eleginoides]|nr:hypothetical protein NQZ68_002733 [Dissostichus eleginoides]
MELITTEALTEKNMHKGPTHFIESVIGQWGSTEGNKPTNEESRYACDEEDAPEAQD